MWAFGAFDNDDGAKLASLATSLAAADYVVYSSIGFTTVCRGCRNGIP